MAYRSRATFSHEHLASPRGFAKGSIRTVRLPRGRQLRVGCPTGHYNRSTGRCRVGTRAVSLLRPTGRRNPVRGYPQAMGLSYGSILAAISNLEAAVSQGYRLRRDDKAELKLMRKELGKMARDVDYIRRR